MNMLCMKCNEKFEYKGMMFHSSTKPQICIGCYNAIRAEKRAGLRKHKQETLKERIECHAFELQAKKDKIAKQLLSQETPILTRYSKTDHAKARKELNRKLDDIKLAEELHINVNDFVGEL